MVHPFLFLQYLRGILIPLLFPNAMNLGGEALENAHKAVDTITYSWLVMAFLIILSLLTIKGLKRMPGVFRISWSCFSAPSRQWLRIPWKTRDAVLSSYCHLVSLYPRLQPHQSDPGFFPPTANVNTTGALAIIVFTTTHVVGIKEHGLKYIKHFLGPVWWLAWMIFFIEIIGHFSRILSLTLRLFGNIGGHEIVIMVFFALVPFFAPLIMTVLGLLVCIIQSIVFMMLSMMYIQGAIEESH